MPTITASQLRLRYVVGTDGTKVITKAKSFNRLVPGISDVNVISLAQKIAVLSEFTATAQRVDTKDII